MLTEAGSHTTDRPLQAAGASAVVQPQGRSLLTAALYSAKGTRLRISIVYFLAPASLFLRGSCGSALSARTGSLATGQTSHDPPGLGPSASTHRRETRAWYMPLRHMLARRGATVSTTTRSNSLCLYFSWSRCHVRRNDLKLALGGSTQHQTTRAQCVMRGQHWVLARHLRLTLGR